MPKYFYYNRPFGLDGGGELPSLTIAYDTWGTLNAAKDNTVWVCHALTANSDVADWWPHTVERGRFLDPEKYFVVCANTIASCYGSTGPLSVNPSTGEPWYDTFPCVTIRDIVRAHQLLAAHLGINHVRFVIGSSFGGFQCMEWTLIDPDFAEKAVFIATSADCRPWTAAFNESQRMAIEADATFDRRDSDAGAAGLAVARSIALLSYRGGIAYNLTQAETPEEAEPLFKRRVHSYQRYQGEKLRRRFNAYSYYRLSQAVDTHNIGRGRGGIEAALRLIRAKTLVVAITSDIIFPPADHKPLVEYIPSVEYHLIDSNFGHDGFLVEYEKLDAIISNFVNQ